MQHKLQHSLKWLFIEHPHFREIIHFKIYLLAKLLKLKIYVFNKQSKPQVKIYLSTFYRKDLHLFCFSLSIVHLVWHVGWSITLSIASREITASPECLWFSDRHHLYVKGVSVAHCGQRLSLTHFLCLCNIFPAHQETGCRREIVQRLIIFTYSLCFSRVFAHFLLNSLQLFDNICKNKHFVQFSAPINQVKSRVCEHLLANKPESDL